MFDRLNNYHANIKLTIFRHKSYHQGAYKFKVYQKSATLRSPWNSKTPKRYKQTTINSDLHCSKRISSNFDEEIPLIREKSMKADYPLLFINSVHFSKKIHKFKIY